MLYSLGVGGWSGLGHLGCVLSQAEPSPSTQLRLGPSGLVSRHTLLPAPAHWGAGWVDRLGVSSTKLYRVCGGGGGCEVRGQSPLLSSSRSISVTFFSSLLMCSSRSTSCPWRQQKQGLSTHLQRQATSVVVHKCGPGPFTQWQPQRSPWSLWTTMVTPLVDPGRVTWANMASDEAHGVCHSQCGGQRTSKGTQLGCHDPPAR